MRVSQRMHRILWAGAAATLAALAVPVAADDTEIYLTTPTTDPAALPLVMLSLDYRPNLGAPICGDTSPGACPATDYFRTRIGGPTGLDPLDIPTPSMNFYQMLQVTLKLVLRKYPAVNIGLMLNHEEQSNCAGPTHGSNATGGDRCSNGGYIARRFLPNNTANQNEVLNILKAVQLPSGSLAHNFQGKELFFELYRYLTGGLIYNGHNGWEDYATDKSTNINHPSDGIGVAPPNPPRPPTNRSELYDWDPLVETAGNTQYIAPIYDNCTKIFTINFLFSVSQQENDSDAAIIAPVASGGLGFNPGTNNDAFPKVLGYLNETDLAPSTPGFQNVTSFFLVKDVPGLINQTSPYARRGGTGEPLPVTDDPRQLEAVLDDVFSQILSVSTTFVAASIPVNVFNRSQAVDNVFLGLFQAEDEPRWNGCLKKLRVKRSNVGTVLVDSLNNFTNPADTTSAFGATDGRIRFNAKTFWTDDSGSLMDLGDANSDGLLDDSSESPQVDPPNYVTKRDGRIVDRGGAGQKIPGFINSVGPGLLNTSTGTPRKLFYDATASSLAALNADAGTASALATSLGVPYATTADQTAALELLKYIRGFDVGGASGLGDGNAATVARPWMFADPLHSRPQPINYGSISGYPAPTAIPPAIAPPNRRPGIFIAVTTNDGYLRFIENTLPTGTVAPATGDAEPASVQSGKELWAFMPRSAMPVQKQLKVNTAIANGPTHPNYDPAFPTRPYSPHPYTIDGSPTVLVKDINGDGTINGADKVYLYFGMRRGGRNYYALDVTDPYTPSLLWTISGNPLDPAYNATFAELGQTFSQPRTGRVRVGPVGSSVLTDVLVFGGGYSNNKDHKILGTDDTVGNAIFVVDAATGALIWKATGGAGTDTSTNFTHANLTDSIPADLAAVDTDGDAENLIDRIVVGDTGGNVWRADLTGSVTSNWKLTRLANLGRHFANDIANDRRFLNRPDLVQDGDELGPYDGVILGSGDREDPLDVRGQVAAPGVNQVTDNWFYVIKDRNIGVGAGVDSALDHDDATLPDITAFCPPVGSEASAPCATAGSAGWKLHLQEASGEKNLAPALTVSGTVFFTSYLKAGTSSDATCGPDEGSGLLYAVKLASGEPAYNYDVVGSPEGDRTQELASGGIPAQVVYLPPLEPCVGASCPIPPPACAVGDEDCLERERCKDGGDIILPDGSVQKVCPLPARPSFWRRREE